MATYNSEDKEGLRYELDSFLEEHSVSELMELVTDAIRAKEYRESRQGNE